MTDVTAHEHPRPWRELSELVRDAESVLLATGQFRAAPCTNQRVGLFVLDSPAGQNFQCAADAWMTEEGLAELSGFLRRRCLVRSGEWDVMYATSWNYAWTADAHDFCLFDKDGKRAWQEGLSLKLRDGEAIQRVELERVEAYLSDRWVERGVALVDLAGKPHIIASQRDTNALLDPTCDELSIFLEASWAVSLATAIANALAIPMTKDKAL